MKIGKGARGRIILFLGFIITSQEKVGQKFSKFNLEAKV